MIRVTTVRMLRPFTVQAGRFPRSQLLAFVATQGNTMRTIRPVAILFTCSYSCQLTRGGCEMLVARVARRDWSAAERGLLVALMLVFLLGTPGLGIETRDMSKTD